MSSLKSKFGKRIKELRKSNGYTQEEVAEMIGIEPTNLSKMENGLHFPQSEKLEKLANVFKVNVMELFDFEHFQEREALIEEINTYLHSTSNKNVEMVYKFIKNLKSY